MRPVLVLLQLVLLTGLAHAEPVGQRLETCLACHGATGQSATADIPSLGAQQPAYVLIQLYMFREGMRQADPMNTMAKGLSDDDLRAFADAIAALPKPVPAEGSIDAARMTRARSMVQRYHCNSCHNADFAGRDNIPRVANQREDYLARTMRQYKANTRHGYDATMSDVLQSVSEAEIDDLAYYLAHLR